MDGLDLVGYLPGADFRVPDGANNWKLNILRWRKYENVENILSWSHFCLSMVPLLLHFRNTDGNFFGALASLRAMIKIGWFTFLRLDNLGIHRDYEVIHIASKISTKSAMSILRSHNNLDTLLGLKTLRLDSSASLKTNFWLNVEIVICKQNWCGRHCVPREPLVWKWDPSW